MLRVAGVLGGEARPGSRGVLDDIELPLVPVLATMELHGITVNRDKLTRLSTELRRRPPRHRAEAYAEIGREVNLGRPKQLQEVLFDELGMPKTRANKTGYSTDAAGLADLQEQHRIRSSTCCCSTATRRSSRRSSSRSTKPSTRRAASTPPTCRAGASTGRIASNDPNLQNIPVKTEVGREIRSAFEVGDGFETLLTADYSQIEMRIMAHLSGDEGLIEAFNAGEDLHRFVGARIFGVDPADVTPAMRTKVKAMSYGLAYGLSAFGSRKQLRIETSRGQSSS